MGIKSVDCRLTRRKYCFDLFPNCFLCAWISSMCISIVILRCLLSLAQVLLHSHKGDTRRPTKWKERERERQEQKGNRRI